VFNVDHLDTIIVSCNRYREISRFFSELERPVRLNAPLKQKPHNQNEAQTALYELHRQFLRCYGLSRGPENVKGRFDEKVALVTGAARSLGRSLAVAFAKEGADLIVNDICAELATVKYPLGTEERLAEVAEEVRHLGRRCMAVKADVSKAVEVKSMVRRAVRDLGKIDILINNAGISTMVDVVNMPDDVWDETIAVNLRSAFLCSKHVARQMIRRKYGRIVNVCSVYGLVGAPCAAHYSASKHGMIGFTRSLAQELAPYDITVNALCPALTDTEMSRAVANIYTTRGWDQIASEVGANTLFPDHRVMTVQDVTEAVLWLCSDSAKYITGVALPVDGGFLTN